MEIKPSTLTEFVVALAGLLEQENPNASDEKWDAQAIVQLAQYYVGLGAHVNDLNSVEKIYSMYDLLKWTNASK